MRQRLVVVALVTVNSCQRIQGDRFPVPVTDGTLVPQRLTQQVTRLAADATQALAGLLWREEEGRPPLLVASQAVPIVIIAPLLVVWFGFGIVPKLAIIALVCFFPVVVTTLDALRSVDPDQLKLMRTLDATRWQSFRWAEAPAALPAALSGAKIAVAVAVIGAVFAEYAGSSEGLGHLMLQAIPQLETARAYAAVVLLAAFAVLLFSALALAERRLVPWTNRRPEGPAR